MKKAVLLIPCLLFPYVLLFAIYCIYTGFLMEEFFDNFFLVLLFYMFIYFVVTLGLNIVFCALCAKRKWEARQIALINMIIKLAQIPAYVAVFLLGIVCLLGIFTIGFVLFFILYDCLSIFLSGMIGFSAVRRCRKESGEGSLLWTAAGILQFVFCADVVCSVIVYKKSDCRKEILPKSAS